MDIVRIILDQLIEKVINNDTTILIKNITFLAKEVFKELGPGYLETVYHKALEIELRKHNIFYISEMFAPILYKNNYVGFGRADFLIDNKIIVEIKALTTLNAKNYFLNSQKQVLHYMKSLQAEKGLIINFPKMLSSVEIYIVNK